MSSHLQKLIEQAKRWKQFFEVRPGVLTIQADEIVGKVVSFYEKIRRILGLLKGTVPRKRRRKARIK